MHSCILQRDHKATSGHTSPGGSQGSPVCIYSNPLALRGDFSSFGSKRTTIGSGSRYMFPNCTDVAIYPFQGCSLEGSGKWRKQPRTMDQLFVAPHLSIQEGFLFWGVIFQRADMHQREVVRENIQGRLLVLLPPSRAGSHSSDRQQFRAGHLQLHAHSSHSGGPGGTISDHAWRHTQGSLCVGHTTF